jgi:hypothetical protein
MHDTRVLCSSFEKKKKLLYLAKCLDNGRGLLIYLFDNEIEQEVHMTETKLWITSREAAQLLTESHGRPISQAHVRRLGQTKRIKVRPIHERTNLYNRRDVELVRIAKRGERKQEEGTGL